MDALDLVRLTPLMRRTSGRPEVRIGLIDGPVATHLPNLHRANVRVLPGKSAGSCAQAESAACAHGTLVAAILFADRASGAPAICPDCALILRPIFPEDTPRDSQMPSATPEELANAIVETVNAGARVINLSAGLLHSTARGERALEQALDYAARRGAITVAAAGNQGTIGSSRITRHPWVIPVAGCNLHGRPIGLSTLGSSIGRRGLTAPGENIPSLGPDGALRSLAGTSAATPFVTGTIALLWSEFPNAPAAQIRLAVTGGEAPRRAAIVPPLLDAWAAFEYMAQAQSKG